MSDNWLKMLAMRESPEFRREGWDGYSALPLTDELLDMGERLLNVFEKGELHICPTGRNTLQFEWENEQKDYFDIELYPNGKMSIVFLRNNDFSTAIQGGISI